MNENRLNELLLLYNETVLNIIEKKRKYNINDIIPKKEEIIKEMGITEIEYEEIVN